MSPEQLLIEELRFRLVQLLGPFGWQVSALPEVAIRGAGVTTPHLGIGARFVARMTVTHPESVLKDKILAHSCQAWPQVLDQPDAARILIDRFARDVVLSAMDRFREALIPLPEKRSSDPVK